MKKRKQQEAAGGSDSDEGNKPTKNNNNNTRKSSKKSSSEQAPAPKKQRTLLQLIKKEPKTTTAAQQGEASSASATTSTTPALFIQEQSDATKMYIGAHVSIAGGYHKAVKVAKKIGANCFAMFVGNQRQWKSANSTVPVDDVLKFKEQLRQDGIDSSKIIVHGSYLANLGSPDPEALKKSRQLLFDEVGKCISLGIRHYVFHPGSTLGRITEDKCCDTVAESINLCHEKFASRQVSADSKAASSSSSTSSSNNCILLIENTAGQGDTIGYKFEHLQRIIKGVNDKNLVGVCVDTCHSFAANYDLRTREAFMKTFEQFDKTVGFKYLKAMHINDSKGDLNCRKDRHENLGKGFIGLECFKLLVNDKRFEHVPLILETPCSNDESYDDEIKLLKSFIKIKTEPAAADNSSDVVEQQQQQQQIKKE